MRLAVIAVSLMAALLCASCGIDFQTKAVDKARNYALDNMKQLSETQRDFIRYTDPIIMDRVIYRMGVGNGKGKRGENDGDMLHLCMVWKVPGIDGAVVVAGHGERSMIEWNPDCILIEDVSVPDTHLSTATALAVSFVMNRMLHLSDAERNHVRFAPPEIFKTKFDIEAEDSKETDRPLARWEAYLKSKETKVQPVQYSFVWKDVEDPSRRIVVCGFSPKASLANWQPREGMRIKLEELEAVTLSGAPAAETRSFEDLLKSDNASKAGAKTGKASKTEKAKAADSPAK